MSCNGERLDNEEQITAMREVQWGPDGSATALEWTRALPKLELDDSRVGYQIFIGGSWVGGDLAPVQAL